jgi:putative protease
MHDYEAAAILADTKEQCGGEQPVVINNLGQISACLGERSQLNSWVAGSPINISNSATVATLADLGATSAWLSPELTLEQVRSLASTSALPLVLTIYGQQQLMVTEHCIFMSQGPCNQDCRNCPRRKAPRLLEDRKNYRLPVWTDGAGRSHIHNAVTLDLVPSIPELLVAGITTFVIDATLLSTKDTTEQIERTKRALKIAQLNGASLKKQEGSTTGHLYRAVD